MKKKTAAIHNTCATKPKPNINSTKMNNSKINTGIGPFRPNFGFGLLKTTNSATHRRRRSPRSVKVRPLNARGLRESGSSRDSSPVDSSGTS